ncbi:MAG: hypothetical protein ACPH9A_07630, partial [Flavobacteriaceae bacterium]
MKKLFLLSALLIFACSSDEGNDEYNNSYDSNLEVSITQISDIDFTSVNLSATYENQYNGDGITTNKGFQISYNENFSLGLSTVNSSSSGLNIEVELTDLNATTNYYVRAFVTDEYGTNYGAVNSFS